MDKTQPKFLVNKILPLSFVDGPGCRTAVFLQGCNIHCSYCHNPETQRRCFNCGKCVNYCRSGALQMLNEKVYYQESDCVHCDECIKHCPNYSSPKCQVWQPNQLLAEIEKNSIFIDGVTFSGGECSLQTDAIVEFILLARNRSKLNVIIDTNCDIATDRLSKLLKHADGFIADLKSFDHAKYRQLTGYDNGVVLKNIRILAEQRLLVEIRTVIVPGHNDNADEIAACAQFVGSLPGKAVWKLIGFRNFGVRGQLGDCPPLSGAKLDELAEIARKNCEKLVVTV